MIERRRYPRYNADIEVEYDVNNDVEIQSRTHTLNISKSGVSIPVNKAIRPGKKIRLKMKMPYQEREVSAVGRVVWKKEIDRNLKDEENAGIQFLSMDRESENALTGYIRNIATGS